MKNILGMLFGLSLILCLPVLAQSTDSCDSLIITGHPSYPPVAWGSQGKIIGASAELVTSIAKKLDIKIITSKDFGSWEKAQEAIKNGQADIIFGIYKEKERVTYMNYVEPPYMPDPVSIVVRKGDLFKYEQWSDLKSRKGITNMGESYGNKFDAYIKKDLMVERAQGVDKAFDALLNKQADYLIIGLYPGKMEARKLNVLAKVDFLPKDVVTEGMYVAFSKKSKCYQSLNAEFSEAIKSDIASGRVKLLLEIADKEFNQQ